MAGARKHLVWRYDVYMYVHMYIMLLRCTSTVYLEGRDMTRTLVGDVLLYFL